MEPAIIHIIYKAKLIDIIRNNLETQKKYAENLS